MQRRTRRALSSAFVVCVLAALCSAWRAWRTEVVVVLFPPLLCVWDFARGRGIGEALLRSIAKCALEIEGGRLEWSVLDWNELAISFYRKIGAESLNEWTFRSCFSLGTL